MTNAELAEMLARETPEDGDCECGERELPAVLTSSDPPSSPWLFRRDYFPNVKIHVRNLGSRWGQTVWVDGAPEIHLAHNLGPISRRCVLAHELVHVALGPPCRRLCPENEQRVQDATARWLLWDLDAVADHLARYDIEGAARRLEVNRSVLTCRLDGLYDAEVTRLGRMLGGPPEPTDSIAD